MIDGILKTMQWSIPIDRFRATATDFCSQSLRRRQTQTQHWPTLAGSGGGGDDDDDDDAHNCANSLRPSCNLQRKPLASMRLGIFYFADGLVSFVATLLM